MFCTQCGARAPEGARFCPKCGAKLEYAESEEDYSEDAFADNASAEEATAEAPSGQTPAEMPGDACVDAALGAPAMQMPDTDLGQGDGASEASVEQPSDPFAFNPTTSLEQIAANPDSAAGVQPEADSPDEPALPCIEQTMAFPAIRATTDSPRPARPASPLRFGAAASSSQEQQDRNQDQGQGNKGSQPKKGLSRGARIAIAVACIAAVAGIGGAGYYFGIYVPEQQRIAADKAAHADHAVRVAATASGWDTNAGASRLPISIRGTDLDGKAVDEVQYADSDGTGLMLKEGDYTFSVAGSPIAADGTIFAAPTTSLHASFRNTDPSDTFDVSTYGTFELQAVDAVTVTDDQINAAYNLAKADADKGAALADTLKQAATQKRDQAVADQRAQEAAKKAEEARKARLVKATSYQFYLPEAWSGRVDVQVMGDDVTISSKQYPDLIVCALHWKSDTDNEARGDYLTGWMGESSDLNGRGGHVEIWAQRWGYTIAELYMKNSSDPADFYSAEEAQEIVDLQSGGSYSYQQVRDDLVAGNDETAFAACNFIGEALAPSISKVAN